MKRCPTCNRTYTDLSLNFCLEDGTPLVTGGPPAPDPNATIRYPGPRDTAEPPPTEIYHPTAPVVTPRPAPQPPPPQQWSPAPAPPPPRKKSNAVWWILGGLAAVLVIGVGLVVMVIALASLGSNTNNSNLNANTRNDNRNSNLSANTNVSNLNANVNLPKSLADDFSEQKWSVGTNQYGRIWYDNGEFHMVSKERTFVVQFAPSEIYNTENATVSVTARSVDGSVPSAGFGLLVHGTLKGGKIEDYALLIYPSEDEPSYQIVMHKGGVQSSLVEKTKSDAIKPGSAPNQLEVRIKGNELSFYANGQYLTRIKDTEDYRRGKAGLYTSDIHEVAFDDLAINR